MHSYVCGVNRPHFGWSHDDDIDVVIICEKVVNGFFLSLSFLGSVRSFATRSVRW